MLRKIKVNEGGGLSCISPSLRRADVAAVAKMCALYQDAPDTLADIQGIGSGNMAVTGEVHQFYEAKAPPGMAGSIHSYKSGRDALFPLPDKKEEEP